MSHDGEFEAFARAGAGLVDSHGHLKVAATGDYGQFNWGSGSDDGGAG